MLSAWIIKLGEHIYLYSSFPTSGMPSVWYTFGYSEFLINYTGGFVRRGLLGDLFFRFSRYLGWGQPALQTAIEVFSYGFYFLVVGWYLLLARRARFRWWVVLMGVVTGADCIIRKDFFGMAGLLLVYALMLQRGNWRSFLAVSVVAVELLCHEAFVFWGCPLFFLMLWRNVRYSKWNYAWIGISIVVVCVVFLCKGSQPVVEQIYTSWNKQMGIHFSSLTLGNSLTALSWQLKATMLHHLEKNFVGNWAWNFAPFVLRPLQFCIVYWFFSSFIFKFNGSELLRREDSRTVFCTLFLFQSVCMLPMFTVLSCDYLRLYQYIIFASFSGFFIVGLERLQKLLPGRCFELVSLLNRRMDSVVPPTRGALLMGLVLIGVSPAFFDAAQDFENSAIGTVLRFLWTAAVECKGML